VISKWSTDVFFLKRAGSQIVFHGRLRPFSRIEQTVMKCRPRSRVEIHLGRHFALGTIEVGLRSAVLTVHSGLPG
jgi:hypothetical protein